MVTPISNDKILPSDSNRPSVSENKGGKAETGKAVTSTENSAETEVAANSEAEQVDLDRANQVYSQSQPQATSRDNQIATPEQAQLVVASLRQQIEEDGALAMQAQGGSASSSALALLEATPA